MNNTNNTNNKRTNYEKIGFTCSAFDLCHAGHMLMLEDCKKQCDYLIVGLQADPSVDNHKNVEYRGKLKNKPVMSLDERKTILEGIKYVDEIFVYADEADLYQKIKNLNYDVRILGSDWEGKKYTGHDLPHTPYFHKRTYNYSTTELRERIYNLEREQRELREEHDSTNVERALKPLGLFKRLAYSFQRS
jgi:glycerol-3-phosphate cytidylyltransferase